MYKDTGIKFQKVSEIMSYDLEIIEADVCNTIGRLEMFLKTSKTKGFPICKGSSSGESHGIETQQKSEIFLIGFIGRAELDYAISIL